MMFSERMMAAYLKAVNEFMVDATPVGAYCLGLGSAAGFARGWLPTRTQMQELVKCSSTEEGEAVVSRLIASNTKPEKEKKKGTK
jgi:hypothetical protein